MSQKNRGGRPPKAPENRGLKKSFFLPARIYEQVLVEMERDRVDSFSGWVAGIIRQEIERRESQRELDACRSSQ